MDIIVDFKPSEFKAYHLATIDIVRSPVRAQTGFHDQHRPIPSSLHRPVEDRRPSLWGISRIDQYMNSTGT
ncbi:hypothetical protein HBH42_242900 [Parastagonospora nodorum]|nr:hypothetical protein HBH42_242900 [Parastagonospora nodorum]KAH6212613.1 hypothetical protein HBI15_143040 [Parastagonospora nodorum]